VVPVARVVPQSLEKHGDVRIDDYYWLRQRDNPAVIDYLEKENAFTEAKTAHTKALRETLFEEIKQRIKQDDASVPYREEDYYYYTRFEQGQQYPLHCRKREHLDAAEEVLLDVNALAKGHDFCAVGGQRISAEQNILAYAIDHVGRRIYTLHFIDLTTGRLLPDRIPNATSNMAWANDNRTLFYTRQDPETLRYHRIYRHELGSDPKHDVLVYEEKDDTFSCYVNKTKSKRYLTISSFQTLSSEYRILDADQPQGQFRVFSPREPNHEYSVDHFDDRFYVRTNAEARNFRLMSTAVERTAREHWAEVIAHRGDVFLRGFEIFKDHLVVEERRNGLIEIRIRPWDGSPEHYIKFDEPAYAANTSTNRSFDTPIVRYAYTSLATPRCTYDYNMVTREKTLLKQEPVLGGYDSGNYTTERLYASASDGTQIPISIVYRKGTLRDGNNPLLLYAYGSYGSSTDASFRSTRVSLLDRGFVFAIAHVRGGQEMGRAWYEDGKLLRKKNTFTDFIAAGEFLVREQYTRPERLFARGGSAGGLLMGAVVNMKPDLFHGVIAAVPFVDVVTTMLDDSIPLTTSEYDEWGNPNDRVYYDYMLSYSPYDNVITQAYPHLLVTTGLHDSQVQYWEPAKWVAKLRTHSRGQGVLLLKTDMDSGHGGASGRYERYREVAFEFAFLLDLAGITE
jgi:oligopeptidase B